MDDASEPSQESETDLPAGANSLEDVPELQQVMQERLVLASNTFFECYKGYHLPAGILAWITLAAFCVFLPIFLIVWSSRRIHTIMSRLGDLRRKR